jgi:hypothetical protein
VFRAGPAAGRRLKLEDRFAYRLTADTERRGDRILIGAVTGRQVAVEDQRSEVC